MGKMQDPELEGALMRKINDILLKLEQKSIAAVLIVMVILSFTQVLSRYVFKYSFPWIEETTRYLMIWLTYIGTAYVCAIHQHISVDVLPEFLKKKQINYDIFINVIIFVFTLIFFMICLKFISQGIVSGQLTPATRIPKWTMHSSMAIGSALAMFHLLFAIVEAVRGKGGKQN